MSVASTLPGLMRAIVLAALGPIVLGACAGTGRAPDSVSRDPVDIARSAIDLARYSGSWHVIAHVPYLAERGHVASTHHYSLRPDGGLAVVYSYRTGFAQPQKTATGRARIDPGSGGRDWVVWLYRMPPARYRVVEVAPDYSWALVDHPGRDLAWVFARDPVIDEALYRELLRRLRGHGVDTDKLWKVPQRPEQVGKLGFAQPKDP